MIFLIGIKVSKHTITSSHLLYLINFEASIVNVLCWIHQILVPHVVFKIFILEHSLIIVLFFLQNSSIHYILVYFLVCISNLSKSTYNYYVVLTFFPFFDWYCFF